MALERDFDVVIIGAGGAGMMCARTAAGRGRKVILLDHSTKIGRKILISGGGRCNFTNTGATADSFVSKNPHFCKSALSKFTPQDFIALVKKHKIGFHEKKLGQLFCDDSASQIVDMLVEECDDAGARFQMDCKIFAIEKKDRFIISTSAGDFRCESLVVATGGLSIPQIGATGFGYDIARQFGLKIVETAPALDGFNFSKADAEHFKDLPGISLDTTVTCNKAAFRENILFTHTGLSGPASLQASLYWHKGDAIKIDLLPQFDAEKWLTRIKNSNNNKVEVKNVLSEKLPKRFAEKFTQMINLNRPINQLNEKQINSLAQNLHSWSLFPAGTVGYRKAEVTRGGVDTQELSSQSMESKKVPGLYFIGEVVDVTGQLGGYNFQWAWASGYAAGMHC
ncbi:MAG: NAD(P)/FAD-dependent oxidoreductase [Candidatus Obscuribacterales bacterium]|nr:NAD(P)/FAD-dependent oxidoreductase [Cyanobacteria bacterium SZAS LIN-5]